MTKKSLPSQPDMCCIFSQQLHSFSEVGSGLGWANRVVFNAGTNNAHILAYIGFIQIFKKLFREILCIFDLF